MLLKADPIAGTFQEEIKTGVSALPHKLKLVGILATSSAPSRYYADFTRKQCEALGIEFELKETGAAANPSLAEGEGVEQTIIESNEDDNVHGIMVSSFRQTLAQTCINRCDLQVYFPIFGVQQVGAVLSDVTYD